MDAAIGGLSYDLL